MSLSDKPENRVVAVYVLRRERASFFTHGRMRTRTVWKPHYLTFMSFHVPPVYRAAAALRLAREIRDAFGCAVWVQDNAAPAVLERAR